MEALDLVSWHLWADTRSVPFSNSMIQRISKIPSDSMGIVPRTHGALHKRIDIVVPGISHTVVDHLVLYSISHF